MKISIFGLGYVGAVTAGCLSEEGHEIIGADVQQEKVDAFNSGKSPIVEPELDALLGTAREKGLLSATTDGEQALRDTEVSIVCVGTPSHESGALNLDYVRAVGAHMGEVIKKLDRHHTIIFRSTMLPGSTRRVVEDFLKDLIEAGKVTVFFCPEFLREGVAVADFRDPSIAVVGTQTGEPPKNEDVASILGKGFDTLSWEEAELIKYACNYFHALKVGFANEIGRVGKNVGLDSRKVMGVVCKDTRLNISSHYMMPGNPFGGSCLPKDVKALCSFARQMGVSLPLLENTMATNEVHLNKVLQLIEKTGKKNVAILGLAFKTDTDDLRGSPMVAVAETLLGRGMNLKIFDPQLNMSALIGSNAESITRRMPHLASLLCGDWKESIEGSDVIIAAQKCVPIDELKGAVTEGQHVIDINGWDDLRQLSSSYEGLCW